jgi:hypothetical protein
MRRQTWIAAFFLTLITAGRGWCGEAPTCEPGRPCLVQKVAPAGGWFPYGGGLLRWWDPHCFPRCGCPDDYCRKPLPCVCWPPYPPWYQCGPPTTPTPVPDGCGRVCPP